ncbi:hypothetical protein PF005_g1348 [Phytophthora fragariae]|uniref:Secreted protein n=1 Tax=Phytophthora fragariae TaxID=53985 RepID=A0A6A4AHE7_9STRA|nr:hypothetical protein PF003_g20905 [Phytophthora fragariae]KAE8949044.1 hypothetical protein PF009_g1412 [Phytophthora fragariae]KAE9029919.1 hypothetical protein PF011_g880 [Phytophthora fragariae]KAE9137981.1 hypothetical protein PF010_g1080 [Phytophthora fragariae]KAE9138503.1 hypothetical protein PF007_g1349 [Phytophthora fragariae]
MVVAALLAPARRTALAFLSVLNLAADLHFAFFCALGRACAHDEFRCAEPLSTPVCQIRAMACSTRFPSLHSRTVSTKGDRQTLASKQDF